jgi:hypothetical protein
MPGIDDYDGHDHRRVYNPKKWAYLGTERHGLGVAVVYIYYFREIFGPTIEALFHIEGNPSNLDLQQVVTPYIETYNSSKISKLRAEYVLDHLSPHKLLFYLN